MAAFRSRERWLDRREAYMWVRPRRATGMTLGMRIMPRSHREMVERVTPRSWASWLWVLLYLSRNCLMSEGVARWCFTRMLSRLCNKDVL